MAENLASRGGKQTFTTQQMVLTGVMAAVVFVSNYISFTIPLAIGGGEATRIHVANAFCLLAGMLLGPVGGGLSAGIGSMFYDLTNPLYIASAPFTFVFKFLMAFVAGKLVGSAAGGQKASLKRLALAGTVGQISYIVLYLGKKFIETYFFLHSALETALVACATAFAASLINAVLAVVISVLLAPAFRKAMTRGRAS